MKSEIQHSIIRKKQKEKNIEIYINAEINSYTFNERTEAPKEDIVTEASRIKKAIYILTTAITAAIIGVYFTFKSITTENVPERDPIYRYAEAMTKPVTEITHEGYKTYHWIDNIAYEFDDRKKLK